MASIFTLSRHLLRDALGDERVHFSSDTLISPRCPAQDAADALRRQQLDSRLQQLRLEKGGLC
ncbi:hypothetical protein KIF53_20745 [Chromobacterium subtsugae]|uniref:Uncharacterized protein n=1 Tax=Chromobacterium subtsugae TaxID=251747 RepID=A0ABS7FJ19_9NEIS|nr:MULTISPECIES: hypothetical protein [Chromobacterium]KUM02243.1 hypothetical protein Cv017_03750 [Chromobacterium subtsugae]KZE86198.1 hypothetical protein AWB61_16815 [Chromobacterium sp. F49]MBW7568045.1 hypothetical protein [Chromobacterium subtsugae]MBW8290073.1 hypothetical protein [Chromobacterium subtsugae]WSE91957.1 hypothetical protein U6115_01565 [Chromobacterium subtsugae]